MQKPWLFLLTAVLAVPLPAADWPMPDGSPQRNGWARSERKITKANVRDLKLLYKFPTENHSQGLGALSAPIISGNLITYRGFKEMLMFGGSSNTVFSVDADLNKLIWEAHLADSAGTQPTSPPNDPCPGGLTAPVITAGSSFASLHFAARAARTPAGKGVRAAHPSPYLPPLAQSIYPLLPTTLTQLNALYTVSSNGYLHVVNSSTGRDLLPAVRFLPPNSKVTSLNLHNNVVYATTGDYCNGYKNAVFAIDLLSPQRTVTSFVAPIGNFAGTAGTAIGNDGTVYVQSAYALNEHSGRYYDAIIALTPKELKVKDYLLIGKKPVKMGTGERCGITPIVFSAPGRDLIIAGDRDGRLYLLDSRSLGGEDHHTPLFVSPELAERSKNYDGNGFRGVFSTWMDGDSGIRRLYVPVFGRLRPSSGLKTSDSKNDAAHILSLELSGTSDHPKLTPLWISSEITSPAPPVIANGMVFVLSTGEYPRLAKNNGKPYRTDEREQLAKPARLYVLDVLTGKELYKSANADASSSLSTGLALANGRTYFTASDNAVYCFGIPAQQSQLFHQ